MFYAERGNKVVSINEESIQKYAEQGYTILNEAGAVVKSTVPVDIPNLKKSYVEQSEKIKTLETENATLKQQIADLQAALAVKSAKVEKTEKAEVADADVVAEKPKKTSKAKITEE